MNGDSMPWCVVQEEMKNEENCLQGRSGLSEAHVCPPGYAPDVSCTQSVIARNLKDVQDRPIDVFGVKTVPFSFGQKECINGQVTFDVANVRNARSAA